MYSNASSVHAPTPQTIFGRARYPVVCFNWRGVEKIIVLSPLVSALSAFVVCFVTLSILATGGYFFLRDDLVKVTLSRQAKMQHAYEDRISAMRAQVDLITSRQLLDQRAVENRMSQLLAKQEKIDANQVQAGKIVSRAKKDRSVQKTSSAKPVIKPGKELRLSSLGTTSSILRGNIGNVQTAKTDDKLLDSLEQSLEDTERSQIIELAQLRKSAIAKAKKLANILKKQGIRVPVKSGIGGPLITLKGNSKFKDSVAALDVSLKTLEKVRRAAKSLPHGSPVPGQKISSRFGGRKDPFTGRRAVHGGLDFKAKRGVSVRATASGKVVKAHRVGGYGKLVEIDHGGGITTRYAHLSRIKVRVGQRVGRGKRIGNVGSTGRSTGPHLHYEVRRKGRAINPIHFVRLEKRLKPYL